MSEETWYPITDESPEGGDDVYVRILYFSFLVTAPYARKRYRGRRWRPAPTTIKTAEPPPLPPLPVCPLTNVSGTLCHSHNGLWYVRFWSERDLWTAPSFPTRRTAILAAATICEAMKPFAGDKA